MKLRYGKVQCDLCKTVVYETQALPMAPDDPFPYICHHCLITGWLGYCNKCRHTFPYDELDIECLCVNCR